MQCPTCGTEFNPAKSWQVYCNARCRQKVTSNTNAPARAAATRALGTRFIGVDGEGYTDALGVHHYAMLSVGDMTLASGTALAFTDIMAFLWKCFEKDKTAAYVGFFLGYDFSQWFRTLPEDRAFMLLDRRGIDKRKRVLSGGNTVPFPVRFDGWEFDILGNKRFKLRKEGEKEWMYVCDTGAFFQASFLSVINPSNWPDGPVCTDEEYATILEGKSHRADEYDEQSWLAAIPELTRYNIAENAVLSNVMKRYELGLMSIGVDLKRTQWYGPGAAAAAFMDLVGTVTSKDLQNEVDEKVLNLARQSYYGGWFEVFAHGIVPGESWEADITSAYPHAMAMMPAWDQCEYEWTKTMPEWGLVDATVEGSDKIAGAMLCRRVNGSIYRPNKVRGVYWSFEIQAAIEAGLVDKVKVHRGVNITWDDTMHQPLMDAIPTLFRQRQSVGKSSPQGKAVKLVLNSLYGKSAQSIGSPKHSNPLAASYITAHCRTGILEAIAAQPDRTAGLLMVATDGVYFANRPVGLVEGSDLGEWEVAAKQRLTIVMPGVHYSDSSREAARVGDLSKLRTRGISAEGFANSIVELDRQFIELLKDPADLRNWPTMEITIKFKVQSPKAALAQGNWETAGTVERGGVRQLSSNPISKREPPYGATLFTFGLGEPYVTERGYVRTFPYYLQSAAQSVPYDKWFGMAPVSDAVENYPDSPDGPVELELQYLLGG